MAIEFRPASREKIGLLIGCIGGTGSGKTLSGLLLARGLCGGDDSKIAVIDTEAGRALHYAPARGQKPGPFTFGFRHGDMKPPFSPEAYAEAIAAAELAGFQAILIDSFSHEYAGDGGLDDIHEEALVKIMRGDPDKREKLSIMAWKEPKQRHKRLVSRLLQCRAHLIICMRAEEKMKISKVQDGQFKKTVVTAAEDLALEERWIPTTEKRFPFELTASLLYVAGKPGVPIPLKLEEQHRAFVPLDKPISAEVGAALTAWARGGDGHVPEGSEVLPPGWDDWSQEERGIFKASKGINVLRSWWTKLPAPERAALESKLPEWKATAEAVSS
jgi:hypothetical protein